MDERTLERLREHLDGTLEPARREELAELLANDVEAQRFVAEHELIWQALGEVELGAPVHTSAEFRERAVEGVRESVPMARRWGTLTAAAAVLVATLFVSSWLRRDRVDASLGAEDQQIVRYLHVLRNFDLIERYERELDLRADVDVLRAFEGELESEG